MGFSIAWRCIVKHLSVLSAFREFNAFEHRYRLFSALSVILTFARGGTLVEACRRVLVEGASRGSPTCVLLRP